MDELNAALTEIGNQAVATYKIPNTGWVTYTFSLKEDVATVKQALDTYIAQMNIREPWIWIIVRILASA